MSIPSSAIEEIVRLAPSDADLGFGEGFGTSVAISGDWIVIGAPLDDQRAHDAGAAYVYRRDGVRWIEHDKLMGLRLEEAKFGYSVATDGEWIVIGSPDLYFEPLSAGPGRADVFTRDDRDTPDDLSDDLWDPIAFLNPPPSHLCCSFGISVDVEGDTIVVGSSARRPSVDRAYVFHWDGFEWLREATVVGSDIEAGEVFGESVTAGADLVAISGVPEPGEGFVVYIFRREAEIWIEEDKIDAADIAPGARLSTTISLSGDNLVVGANGSAYLFRRDSGTWSTEARLTPDPRWDSGGFGLGPVAIDDDRVVVAGFHPMWGHLFRRAPAGWVQIYGLEGPEVNGWKPVAVSERYALVGTYVYAVDDSVSLRNYAKFQTCFATDGPLSPGCERFDLEPNGQIDLSDYALFIQTWRGP